MSQESPHVCCNADWLGGSVCQQDHRAVNGESNVKLRPGDGGGLLQATI